MPYLLRKGKDWCLPERSSAVDRFHQFARHNGSSAIWLCQSGALVTNIYEEQTKNFPYEQWREEALKGMPGISPGGA